MKVEKINVKACCGKTKSAFKLSSPLSLDILPLLINAGFVEGKHFTKAGILYAENAGIIVNGNFNSNVVHVSCKVNDCAGHINNFESLLTSME